MNIPTQNQRGFSAIVIILLIVLAGALGFLAWRMYDTNQQANNQNQTNTNNQNTQPTDPNAGYVVIKEWGVRFKPVEGLKGVEYFKPKNVTTDAISITTEELGKIEPGCSTNSESMVLGLLTRSKDPQPVNGGVIAKIGDYSFQYRSSGAACGEDSSDYNLESKTAILISQSIKSLEAAK